MTTPNEKAYIVFVLDESGSMQSALHQTINGFNEQIQQIKANLVSNIDTLVTLITFNGTYHTQYINVPADQVAELDVLTYKPSGMTALYDAMGEAITVLKASPNINDETTSVLMVVISDGDENSSTMYSSKEIKDTLESYQEQANWTVTYMGANANVAAVAQNIGVVMGNTAIFSAASAAGYESAFMEVKSGLDGYMKMRGASGANGPAGPDGASRTLRKSSAFYTNEPLDAGVYVPPVTPAPMPFDSDMFNSQQDPFNLNAKILKTGYASFDNAQAYSAAISAAVATPADEPVTTVTTD